MAADEGMWLVENFPSSAVEKKYGIRLDKPLLDHFQLAAVRFNNGGTGSFVSAQGLLFTNHHVGSDCIQKLGSKEADYLKKGFYAASQADEKSCPDLEVNVLRSVEDVTVKVESGIQKGTAAAEANQKRKAAMTQIEEACNSSTGLRCDVVTLFSGAKYHLYRYKKYTDIRLVFAPEFGIAFFGGDPDNFTFPRYCLDIAFFRAYENGQPAKVDHFFRWSKAGVKDGEVIFVPGNPGTTGRLAPTPELKFLAEESYPLIFRRLQSLIAALEKFMAVSDENRRIAQENLFGQQNSLKAYTGFLSGLRDPRLLSKKEADEAKLKASMATDPAKRHEFARFWDELSTAYAEYRTFFKRFSLFERQAIRGSDLFTVARDVLRYSEEKSKANEVRLREYTTAALPSLEQSMYSEAPIHDSMEIVVVANYIEFLVSELGNNEPTVVKVLGGRTPLAAAEQYVRSSRLQSVEERKRLANDPKAVQDSTDGIIVLAKILDQPARELRKRYEDRIESVITSTATTLAKARFAVSGGSDYPDATFTLRVSYGAVKGYSNEQGKAVPFATTIGELYHRAKDVDPYVLPDRWIQARKKLKADVALNFVTTADTHGGNSGSATVNSKGEIVGILFDGNLEGLPNRFVYDELRARSVHVASQGIVEALRGVYGAERVLTEIGASSR